MEIEILEINPLGEGKFSIAFNGTNDFGHFGLVAEYRTQRKQIKFLSVYPRQWKSQFKIPALAAIAKEPKENFL